MLYTVKQAAEYLGINHRTFKDYIAADDIPIAGQLVNARMRVFTQAELDEFRDGYLTKNPVRRGRPWHKGQPLTLQRVADELVNLTHRIKHLTVADKQIALDAIKNLERAGWYPDVFDDALPATIVEVTDDGLDYAGYIDEFAQTIETLVERYLKAVEDGGGTVSRE